MSLCGTCEGTCAGCSIARPGGCPSYVVPLRDAVRDNRGAVNGYSGFVSVVVGPMAASGVLAPLAAALVASSAFLQSVGDDCEGDAAIREAARIVRGHCLLTAAVGSVVGVFVTPLAGPVVGGAFEVASAANAALAGIANDIANGREPSAASVFALAVALTALTGLDLGPLADFFSSPENVARVEQHVASNDEARRALENPGGSVNPRQVVANNVMQRCGGGSSARNVISLYLTEPVASHIVERTLFKKAWERAGAPADCTSVSGILRELWGESVAPAPPPSGGGIRVPDPPKRENPFPNAPKPPTSGGGFAAIAAGALVGFFVAGPPGGVVGGVAAAFLTRPKASSSAPDVPAAPRAPSRPIGIDRDPGDRMDWVNRTP